VPEANYDLQLLDEFLQVVDQDENEPTATWASELAARSSTLLAARRNAKAEAEAKALDAWGPALDRAELLNAILGGFIDVSNVHVEEAVEPEALQQTWLGIGLSAVRCIEITDDIHLLLRAGSLDSAFGCARSLHESSVIARSLSAHPDAARDFLDYQERTFARAQKEVFRAWVRASPEAAQRLAAAEREERQLRNQSTLHPGDLGWAHETLLQLDPEYAQQHRRGLREKGPFLSDLERLVQSDPPDRALRAMANLLVHGNVVSTSHLEAESQALVGVLIAAAARITTAAAQAALAWAIANSLSVGIPSEAFDHLPLLEDEVQRAIDQVSDPRP
jgi:hypothetical protein